MLLHLQVLIVCQVKTALFLSTASIDEAAGIAKSITITVAIPVAVTVGEMSIA